MDRRREQANAAASDFAVLLRPEVVESARQRCLKVDRTRDSFGEG